MDENFFKHLESGGTNKPVPDLTENIIVTPRGSVYFGEPAVSVTILGGVKSKSSNPLRGKRIYSIELPVSYSWLEDEVIEDKHNGRFVVDFAKMAISILTSDDTGILDDGDASGAKDPFYSILELISSARVTKALGAAIYAINFERGSVGKVVMDGYGRSGIQIKTIEAEDRQFQKVNGKTGLCFKLEGVEYRAEWVINEKGVAVLSNPATDRPIPEHHKLAYFFAVMNMLSDISFMKAEDEWREYF